MAEKNDPITPMMRQYKETKEKYPDAILFYRLGDFYEMFFEDAKLASSLLQIVLTKRGSKGASGTGVEVPMCGIPYHSALNYITKLIKLGYKVAICEQVEDPKLAKGLVKREVVKLITPGTVLEDSILSRKSNNFLAAVFISGKKAGLAFADVSTGEFLVSEIPGEENRDRILEELSRFNPAELLLPSSFEISEPRLVNSLKESKALLNFIEDYYFDRISAEKSLKKHFKVGSLEGFGLAGMEAAIPAAWVVLDYLTQTQKNSVSHINKLTPYNSSEYMVIDASTRRNLELLEKMTDRSAEGTLYSVLDRTVTSMGGRLLKRWISEPLVNIEKIKARQTAVEELAKSLELKGELAKLLSGLSDFERLAGKIGCRSVNAKELNALKSSLELLPSVKRLLKVNSALLLELKNALRELPESSELIGKHLVDDPPASLKEGNFIKDGVDQELDRLRALSRGGKEWIAAFQEKERKRTGISSLKIGFNSVFGYYIELSKSNQASAPADYIRKQTLANAERYITQDLKEYETLVLSSEDKISSLEAELFDKLRDKLSESLPALQENARFCAELDCLASFAEAAVEGRYVRPEINDSGEILIEDGRHPVVERLVGEGYIPNDVKLNNKENLLIIITGPNMAGKSTYLRQAALITLMAQLGSFVPAAKASIGIVDRIFTRVGASDNIALGHSTFMVEMLETANILNNATSKSLIILDEIGRGTATFDGISIAWAVAEHIRNEKTLGAKTLFATHFYELTEMALTNSNVKNYNITVKEKNDEIIFLRKIVEGAADRSYGIQVARLAGLPQEVLERAKEILRNLENANYDAEGRSRIGVSGLVSSQLSIFAEEKAGKKEDRALGSEVLKELQETDVNGLTPLEALNKLNELKKKADFDG